MTMLINCERDDIMKKMSLVIGGMIFLVGCTQTTRQSTTTTTEATIKTTQMTVQTTTQTTTTNNSSSSSTINDNLEVFLFDNKSFGIRASRRWLKIEPANGENLSLVGYRSRVNVFFNVTKTSETTLENVATNSFKEYATQYGITATLPLIPLKNVGHPTIKTIYEIKRDSEKKVIVLYVVNVNNTYITVACVVSSDIFEEIREELNSIVNSLAMMK